MEWAKEGNSGVWKDPIRTIPLGKIEWDYAEVSRNEESFWG